MSFFSRRRSARSVRVVSVLFGASRVLAVLLQFSLAVAVFRHVERAFERQSVPCLASEDAFTELVST